MIGRMVVVAAAAALVAVQVVRNAAVGALASAKPEAAAQFWSGHPGTEIATAMTLIATAARHHRAVPPEVFADMGDAADKEPLAPEPYLVRGVQAELTGDGARAQEAFEAAQWRDPRSLPAAYFLADRYFRTGDVARGLAQVGALARLAPNGNITVAPYLAAYARNPANWPALRTMFRANPAVANSTLLALSSNIATAPAALALADPREKVEDAFWLGPLINTLVGAGQYARAHQVWERTTAAGTATGQLIYDASFSDKKALPPFNWALTSSGIGFAERQAGGRLHLVFYGQEDGILASELLTLAPGAYRLSMQLAGDPARARVLNWSIWCDGADAPIASTTLESAARGWQFSVPINCPAQWLKLSGASGDLPQQAEATISHLKLERVTSGT